MTEVQWIGDRLYNGRRSREERDESNIDDEFRVKVGLAEMLKGGVIMDVTTR